MLLVMCIFAIRDESVSFEQKRELSPISKSSFFLPEVKQKYPFLDFFFLDFEFLALNHTIYFFAKNKTESSLKLPIHPS